MSREPFSLIVQSIRLFRMEYSTNDYKHQLECQSDLLHCTVQCVARLPVKSAIIRGNIDHFTKMFENIFEPPPVPHHALVACFYHDKISVFCSPHSCFIPKLFDAAAKFSNRANFKNDHTETAKSANILSP